MCSQPRRWTLFPYTTLFRSQAQVGSEHDEVHSRVLAGSRPLCRGCHRDGYPRLAGHRGRLPAKTRERSEEHTSELQSLTNLVFRLLLAKEKHKIGLADRDQL